MAVDFEWIARFDWVAYWGEIPDRIEARGSHFDFVCWCGYAWTRCATRQIAEEGARAHVREHLDHASAKGLPPALQDRDGREMLFLPAWPFMSDEQREAHSAEPRVCAGCGLDAFLEPGWNACTTCVELAQAVVRQGRSAAAGG